MNKNKTDFAYLDAKQQLNLLTILVQAQEIQGGTRLIDFVNSAGTKFQKLYDDVQKRFVKKGSSESKTSPETATKQAQIVSDYAKSPEHQEFSNQLKDSFEDQETGKDIVDGMNQALTKITPKNIMNGLKNAFDKEIKLDQEAFKRFLEDPNTSRRARFLLASFITFTSFDMALSGGTPPSENFGKAFKKNFLQTLSYAALELGIGISIKKVEILREEKQKLNP